MLPCRAGRSEVWCVLSDSDGHPRGSKEWFVEGRPGWLLAQILLQPLEQLAGCFLLAQLTQAAQQSVVQGSLQQR